MVCTPVTLHTCTHRFRDNNIIVPEHTAMQIGKMACVAIRRSLPSISIILMHCYWWPALTQLTVRERERERGCVVFEKSIFLPSSFSPDLLALFFFLNNVAAVTYVNFSSLDLFDFCRLFVRSWRPRRSGLNFRIKGGIIPHFSVHTFHALYYFFASLLAPLFPLSPCVCVCVWSWENGLLILVCSLAPRLVVLAQVWSPRLDRGAFVVADGTELSQVAHTEHAPWRADGRKVKELWFLIVSRRLLGCVWYPQSTSSIQELLFFNQWPPLPGSRDTPLQDFISVSHHNWAVSSLGKNNARQDIALWNTLSFCGI